MKITIENATEDEIRVILEKILTNAPADSEMVVKPEPAPRLLNVGDRVTHKEYGIGKVVVDDGCNERRWPYQVEFDAFTTWCTAGNPDDLDFVTRIEPFRVGQEVILTGKIVQVDKEDMDDTGYPYEICFGATDEYWLTDADLRACLVK